MTKFTTIQLNIITSKPATARIAVQNALTRTLSRTWMSTRKITRKIRNVFSAKTSLGSQPQGRPQE